ncbi:MAG TPA: non-homologous end-joining DNA ligase [Kofleriaceae bacterium]
MQYEFGDLVVPVTSTDRVVFPASGITKGDVIAYYADVAPLALPELRGRPLTVERFTKGLAGGGFFQKHAQKHYPAWIDRVSLGAKTVVEYPICDSAAALVYFANQGALALHIWTSRKASPDHPDLLVFDLDPPPDGFALVRRVALLLRDALEALALPAFVKTTGSKGLHLCVPLDGAAPFANVTRLGDAIARALCLAHPDLVTTEFYKKDRGGRLFLDTMRNAPGATLVAPYSLRGREPAPLSAPIAWAEVESDALRPDGVTLRSLRARLDEVGDPWAAFRAAPASASAVLAKLGEA